MLIFVTGASGFIGQAVVKELISNGHQVLALSRSDKSSALLESQGARVIKGSLGDLDVLSKGASESDAVIHLGFVHDFTDFAGGCATDRAAITALGEALAAAGGDRALVVTSGTMMLPQGKLATEDTAKDETNMLVKLRGPSEEATLAFVEKGVRAVVVRLPPTTYGPGASGFMAAIIDTASKKNLSAYVDEGKNVWSSGHRDDAAKLYRLAAEKGKAGSVYHAVGEEPVPFRAIAEEVGKQLGVPVESISKEKAEEHFGFLSFAPLADNITSSQKTRDALGWTPTSPGLIETIPIIVKTVLATPQEH